MASASSTTMATMAYFNSHEWRTHCDTNAQTYSFCGVSAHHQNPLAENAIRRITNRARTAMMTTTLHWDLLSTLTNFNLQDFWPFACYTFAELDNDLPRSQQQHSPLSIFSKTSQSFHLRNFHVWGCPVYVLDPKLADGKTLPRWEPRSRLGLYLGPSPSHSTSVALVLNLKTRRISPQYHVVFDDRFHTVNPNQRELSALWDQLYSSNREVYAEPSEFPPHEPIPYEWTDATPDSSATAPVDSASIPASPAPSGPPSPPPPSVASPLAPPAPSTPSSSSSPSSSPSAPASPLPQKQVRFQRESATPTNLSSDLFAETPSDSSRNSTPLPASPPPKPPTPAPKANASAISSQASDPALNTIDSRSAPVYPVRGRIRLLGVPPQTTSWDIILSPGQSLGNLPRHPATLWT